MNKIVVIGANPAWQKSLFFANFRPGEVNRAQQMNAFASGKGINFSRALRIGKRAEPCLVQFTGGDNGVRLTRALADEGIRCHDIATASETRCCITCLCQTSGKMTELIEPSATPTEVEETAFIHAVEREISDAAAIAVCGTLPGQLTGRIYLYAVEAAKRAGVPILIDAWRDIRGMLESGRGAHVLLKINREELFLLAPGDRPVTAAMRELIAEYHLTGLGITDGPGRAYWGDAAGRIWEFTLSQLEHVVSPLGCGDTTGAILLGEYAAGTPGVEAFAAGLAAAQANCLNSFCGNFRVEDAERFRRELKIREKGDEK